MADCRYPAQAGAGDGPMKGTQVTDLRGRGNNLLGSSRAPHVPLGTPADPKKSSNMVPDKIELRNTGLKL